MRIHVRFISSLSVTAAIVFILIVIGGMIRGGASGIARFIENYYVIIGIVLALIIAGICVYIYRIIEEELSTLNKIINSAASGLLLSQNAAFLVYGLYRALTVHPDDAFLTILGVGGYILFYVIDLFISGAGIALTFEKWWGSVIMVVLTVIGYLFVMGW